VAQAAPQRSTDDLRESWQRLGYPPPTAWQGEIVKLAQDEALQGDLTRVNQLKAQCEHLLGFTEYRYPRYRPAPVHRFVCTHLERVERREIDRLMILMPPRHGKTELASKRRSVNRQPRASPNARAARRLAVPSFGAVAIGRQSLNPCPPHCLAPSASQSRSPA
jgi:hypothetical protein